MTWDRSSVSDRTPVAEQVVQGAGEVLGPLPVQPPPEPEDRRPRPRGWRRSSFLLGAPPTTLSACFTTSGGTVTPTSGLPGFTMSLVVFS